MWRTLHITSCGTLCDNTIPTVHFKDTRVQQQTAHESGPQRSSIISILFNGNQVVCPSQNFVSRNKQCLCQSMAPNGESQERHSFPDLMKPIILSTKWHNFGTLATESIKVSGQRLTSPEKKIATYRNAQFVAITAKIKSFQILKFTSPPLDIVCEPNNVCWPRLSKRQNYNFKLSNKSWDKYSSLVSGLQSRSMCYVAGESLWD